MDAARPTRGAPLSAVRARWLPGGLRLVLPLPLLPRIERWVTWEALPVADPHSVGTPSLELVQAPPSEPLQSFHGASTIGLGRSETRIEGDEAWLRDDRAGAFGTLALAERRGRVRVKVGDGPLDDLLTVATALLLGRRGRALVHAGAVTDRRGRGWLVVADARAGKSTACATLARDGWGFLSDDQTVLLPAEGGPTLDGWPRPLRLDAGWPEGPPTGRRVRRTAAEAGLTRRRGPVSLEGLLLPGVRVGEPTRAERASAGDALVALIRQSPWLMADRRAAPGLLELLERVVERPAFRLRLGREAFGDPGPIERALAEAGA